MYVHVIEKRNSDFVYELQGVAVTHTSAYNFMQSHMRSYDIWDTDYPQPETISTQLDTDTILYECRPFHYQIRRMRVIE